MHSPSISNFDVRPNAVHGPVSSTGFAAVETSGVTARLRFTDPNRRSSEEVLYAPMVCGLAPQSVATLRSARTARERTESNKFSRLARDNSNGKERQISALALLLNWANTSGIRLFADPQRQSSAWTDDMVMDRGAEGAARGCDAV